MFKRLGDLLKERELVKEADIVEALKASRLSGRKIGKELVASGAVSERDLVAVLGEHLGVKIVSLSNCTIDAEVAALVPREVCEKYLCVALELGPDDSLAVAMDDPVDLDLVQRLTLSTGKHIVSCIATVAEIRETIKRVYDAPISLDERRPDDHPVEKNLHARTRVLVVDDEAAIRKALGVILRQIDCEVVEARDGRDALDKIEMARPDLIISDINMPVMDGYELCRQVRNDMNIARIPFIMLTSRDNAEDKLKGFLQGTDDYVTKPFDYRELQARVKNLIDHADARAGEIR